MSHPEMLSRQFAHVPERFEYFKCVSCDTETGVWSKNIDEAAPIGSKRTIWCDDCLADTTHVKTS